MGLDEVDLQDLSRQGAGWRAGLADMDTGTGRDRALRRYLEAGLTGGLAVAREAAASAAGGPASPTTGSPARQLP